MKQCGRCKLSKPIIEFRLIKGKHHSYCQKCQSEYDKDRFIAKRELRKRQITEQRDRCVESIRALKNNPCTDCKTQFHFSAMQFDHRPNEIKVGDVSSLASTGQLQKALIEIAKCDLVCANCHAVRTWKRQNLQAL